MTAAPSAPPTGASAKDAHGCLPRGYRLREFVIERVLGDGGFGVVYSALDLRLERRVAIKEYMPSALARRDTDYSVQMLTSPRHRDAFQIGLRSFINEARMLARFEHPALIKVHQFWQEKGTAYMVMPFYAAPTLRTWVRARRQAVSEAWLRAFLLQAMEAVEVLHAESCLHRDIAPDNILVLDESRPLLLDFGAARRVIGDLRKALTVIVKPGFAPLEQYADTVKMKQGPWTDVYALAAVAHFVITGQPPAPAVSRVLADEVVPLRVRAKGRFSDALLGALDTALAVKPERRPQTIAAFRDLMLSTQAGEWEPTRLVCRTQPATRAPVMQAPITRAPVTEVPPVVSSDDETTVVLHGAAVVPEVRSTPAAHAQSMQRSVVRFADVGTLTQAVRATFAAESRYSRWIGCAGYAAAMLAFGGVLFMTSKLVERYIDANVRGGATAVVVAASPAASGSVETARAPAPSASPATARAETKPAAVTLTPVRIDATVPTTAPHGEPLAPVAQAAPASERPISARPPKPKATAATKVSAIEHAPREAGKPALLLTAALPAPAYADPSGGRVKSRGLEEMVVPLERGGDIAQVAPVELVVAPPEPATAAPGAPLRAIAKPEPQFPAAALKEGVRDGRVLAQMTVNSDGTVGRVDIVEAQPRHVFDKEVRRALAGWRYEAPGRPREAAVEFVFRRDE